MNNYKHDVDITAMNLTQLKRYLAKAERQAQDKLFDLIDGTPRTAAELNALAGNPYSSDMAGSAVSKVTRHSWDIKKGKKKITRRFVELNAYGEATNHIITRNSAVTTYRKRDYE